MPSLPQSLIPFFAIALLILSLTQPIYWHTMQYKNWKEISSEYGFRYDFKTFPFPTMHGEFMGHAIVFQNAIHLIGRLYWSQLQIWVKINTDTPVRFILYQPVNKSYRPSALNHLERQNIPLDNIGKQFILESKTALENSLLQDPHLINLFTINRCIGLAVDGEQIYYERNNISCSTEELKIIMEDLIYLADCIESQY